jgi:hypothetical protein
MESVAQVGPKPCRPARPARCRVLPVLCRAVLAGSALLASQTARAVAPARAARLSTSLVRKAAALCAATAREKEPRSAMAATRPPRAARRSASKVTRPACLARARAATTEPAARVARPAAPSASTAQAAAEPTATARPAPSARLAASTATRPAATAAIRFVTLAASATSRAAAAPAVRTWRATRRRRACYRVIRRAAGAAARLRAPRDLAPIIVRTRAAARA